jgi:polygalacturonase
MDRFADMSVTVWGADGAYDIELYATPTNPKRNFPAVDAHFKDTAVAMFDMEGTVVVEVTYPAGVESAIVRPARAGIEHTVEGNIVIFELTEWGQYTVEFNGDPETDALTIFANPPSVVPEGARIVTGRHDGDLTVEEGETVYLAPGSVVFGTVVMSDNSALAGRGIVAKSGPPAIQVWNISNISLEGVAILDPNRWVVEFQNSTDITVENIKIISARNNGDGITIQSSSNITINKSFVRTWDDNVVLKNYTRNNTFDITVTNCVMWTDLAQTLEIGFETNKGAPGHGGRTPSPNTDPQIYNVLFEDIDIIHNFHKAPISIHNADGCRVYDITFRNIIVDNARMGLPGNFSEGGGWSYLIDFCNATSADQGGAPEWTHNDGDREIRDILVENVWVLGGTRAACNVRFINRSSGEFTSVMENVVLRNIYFRENPLDFEDEIEMAGMEGMVIQTNEPYFHWSER